MPYDKIQPNSSDLISVELQFTVSDSYATIKLPTTHQTQNYLKGL